MQIVHSETEQHVLSSQTNALISLFSLEGTWTSVLTDGGQPDLTNHKLGYSGRGEGIYLFSWTSRYAKNTS